MGSVDKLSLCSDTLITSTASKAPILGALTKSTLGTFGVFSEGGGTIELGSPIV